MSEQSNQFPYREASSRTLSDVIQSVQGFVVKLAHDMNHWGLNDDQLDELSQRCMIHLWERCLPRYDATRSVKVSTYLHTCIFLFYRLQMPREYRRSRKADLLLPDEAFNGLAAPDQSCDNKISDLADAILNDPCRFLPEQQAEVLRVITSHPKLSKKEIADMVGYAFPASLSHILKRIRRSLADLDIDAYEKEEASKSPKARKVRA